MTDRNIDITIRARAAIAEAFAESMKAIDALDAKANQSTKTGSTFGGTLKSAFGMATVAAGAALTGVTALGAGILALGQRGADVADLRDSFNQMNKSFGQDGPKSLAVLRTAFAGTVSDYDLMKSANTALSLKLKLSSEDFGLLGKSARVLADRTGGDATTAFATLTQAMATGKVKTLQSIGVMVDAEVAAKTYAKAHNLSAGELSKAQIVEANAIATKRELARMLGVTGEAAFDFGDAVQAAKTFVGNFKDSLGEAIAQSPVVNAMLASFGKGVQASFGMDQAGLIKTLIGYVNKFAVFLVDVADVALSGAGYMGKAWSGLQMVFAAVNGAILGVSASFNEMVASALELATKIPGLGDSFKGAAWQARDLANQTKGMAASFKDQYEEAHEGVKGNNAWGKAITSAQAGLSTMRGEMVKALTSAGALNDETKKAPRITQDAEDATREKTKAEEAAEKQQKKLTAEMDKFAKGIRNDLLGGVWIATDAIKDFKSQMKEFEKSLPPISIGVKNLTNLWREYPKAVESAGEAAKKAADNHDKAMASMKASLASLSDAFGLVAQTSKGSLGEVSQWLGTVITTGNLASKGADTMKTGWNQLSGEGKNVAAGLVNIAAGAMSVYAATMQATESTNKTKNALSGAFAGAQAGSMFGPWGTAIGAVGGAIFGLFRAGSNASAKAAKEMAAQQAKLAADIKAAQDKLLADLQAQLATAKTEYEGLAGQAKDMGYVFDEAGKLIGVRFDKMKEVADSYGLGLADLGSKFQSSQLHDKAMKIVADFELLDKGGANVGGTIYAMKDKIQAVVDESRHFGGAIPENMRPLINALIEGGHLTDDQGNKLRDMSGIKFGEAVKSQFDTIQEGLLGAITKMNDLLTAILALPTNKKVTIETHRVTTGDNDNGDSGGDNGGDSGDGGKGGGRVNPWDGDYDWNGDGRNENGYAVGGIVNAPMTGMGVTVHGREAIIPLNRPSVIGSQMIREIIAVSDRRTGQDTRLAGLEQAVAALTQAVTMMPSTITRSNRDSQLSLGTRH